MGNCGGSNLPIEADLTPYVATDEMDTVHVVVMVNGKSGGNKAKEILDLGFEHYRIDSGFHVWIYDIMNADTRAKGMDQLKELKADPRSMPRIIACGGDGTVKWVISLLHANECLDVPIGVIPFGTGNDFSRVCGWGGYTPKPLIGKQMKDFNKRLEKMSDSNRVMLDVWKIEILLKNEGEFRVVKNKREEVCEKETKDKVMVHEMMNYFSIGADASIVFEFEKNRKSTQLKNKAEYGRQGTKQLVNPPPKLSKFIEQIQSSEESVDAKLARKFLVWQNIASYGGGNDIWGLKKKNKNGLGPQDFGDQKLELMSVMGGQYVLTSQVSGGAGIGKIAQKDNYSISFKDSYEKPVYFQVDGEGIKATGVREVSITHRYQVAVLKKDL